MRLLYRHATLLPVVAACLLTSCASAQPRGMARFVQEGEPKIRLEGTAGSQIAESLEDYVSKVRTLSVKMHPHPTMSLSLTVESWDPGLRAALVGVAVSGTAANHRVVAAHYRRLGILDAAYGHLARALRLDPTDAAAYDETARIWRDWGFPHLGLRDAHRAIRYAPTSATPYNTLGTLLQALDRSGEAQAAYEHALSLDAGAAYAFSNLCQLFRSTGVNQSAIQACRSALDADPTLIPARNGLALAYAAEGLVEAAAETLQPLPDAASREYALGVVYFMNRRFAIAAQSFERAYRLRPTRALARVRAGQARVLSTTRESIVEERDVR